MTRSIKLRSTPNEVACPTSRAPRIRVERTDVLALSEDGYRRWCEVSDAINGELFARPLPRVHREREGAVFFRAVQFYVGDRCVGRAGVRVQTLRLYDPELGRVAPVYVVTSNIGVLPRYDDRVRVHPFVTRMLLRFHATRHGRAGHSVYGLAMNFNPLCSYMTARYFTRVHPLPQREQPAMERLRDELLARLFPAQLESVRRTGLMTGPSSPLESAPIRRTNELLGYYIDLNARFEGARVPMLMRLNARDLLRTAYKTFCVQLARQLGVHDPREVAGVGIGRVLRRFAASIIRPGAAARSDRSGGTAPADSGPADARPGRSPSHCC